MIRVPTRSLAVLAMLALVSAAAPSQASDSCRDEAKQTYKDCGGACKEDYQAAKDSCLNRDHQCVEACRADRYDCMQATGLDDAINACNDTLAAARAQCRADHPAGSPERDACVDQAQVVAFQCRDSARETAKPAVKACRVAFLSCAKACPPASPSAPADPRQCKLDAKTAYKTCTATCLEDFQLDKDACRHRDHACVEQCRADREVCRQPVVQQLENDIAACNATRDAAIANCKSLYGDGTPERDQCIDNAQVAAFECRDQAHENSQPGFATCRQNFKTCAQACPPA